MRDHVYSRDQLLELRQPAEDRRDDVTRRRVWAAGLGRESSRARGRRAGNHQQTAAAQRSADRRLDTVALRGLVGVTSSSVKHDASHHVTRTLSRSNV